MKLIIAEKPSVAREFASYLRALDDKKGTMKEMDIV